MEDFSQTMNNPPDNDVITAFMRQNAPQQPSMAPPMLPQQIPSPVPIDQQMTPMQVLSLGAQSGNPQANSLLKMTNTMTGGDPAMNESAINFMHALPNQIDPSNSYQVYTALAQWARQNGINGQQGALTMPSPEQISMQDLGNIASGKGTNFLGLQQGAAKDIADLNLRQAESQRYAAMAANGGTGGTTGFVYNKLAQSLQAAGVPITPELNLQLIGAARNGLKAGQTFTINGQQVSAENIPGFTEALAASSGAEEGGKQGAMISAAAPKAEQGELGHAKGAAEAGLATMSGSMPEMYSTINDLKKLAMAATYTIGGQSYNALLRQLGQPMTAGGNARAEFQSRVNNYLIPSLKTNFGSRITNMEINAQKAMFANPDMSPTEKMAQFQAFIDQKEAQLQAEKNTVTNLGGNPEQFNQQNNQPIPQPVPRKVINWVIDPKTNTLIKSQ